MVSFTVSGVAPGKVFEGVDVNIGVKTAERGVEVMSKRNRGEQFGKSY